jgi:hypothetical protein
MQLVWFILVFYSQIECWDIILKYVTISSLSVYMVTSLSFYYLSRRYIISGVETALISYESISFTFLIQATVKLSSACYSFVHLCETYVASSSEMNGCLYTAWKKCY